MRALHARVNPIRSSESRDGIAGLVWILNEPVWPSTVAVISASPKLPTSSFFMTGFIAAPHAAARGRPTPVYQAEPGIPSTQLKRDCQRARLIAGINGKRGFPACGLAAHLGEP